MRDDVLNVLQNSNGALDIYDLQDALQITDVEKTKELMDVLHELTEDCTIYHSNKDKYLL